MGEGVERTSPAMACAHDARRACEDDVDKRSQRGGRGEWPSVAIVTGGTRGIGAAIFEGG